MSETNDRMRKAMQQPLPAEHPSAEMLNAYAEHALTAAEQRGVEEHLAACRGCRDVLFLVSACEEADRAQAAAAAPLPKRRVRWWTWAVPVAAVLAVGSTVLVMHPWQLNAPRQEMAAKQAAPPPPSATEETRSESEKTSASDVATMLKDAPRKERAVRRAPVAAPAVTPPKEQYRAGEDKSEPTLMAQNKVDAVQPAAKSAPVGAAAAGVGGNRDALQNAPAEQGVVGGIAAARAPAPAASSNTTVEVSSETALLDAQPSTSTNEAMLTQKKTNVKRMAAASTAEYGLRKQADHTWLVTGTGLVEHLADGSWHTVPVAKNAYITVVTASGENVWAAARGGALYYSANGGGRWERLVAPGGPELVGLTSVSATELRARTAEGKNLASHDGGKTWAEE